VVCVVAVGSRLAPGLFGSDPVAVALRFDRLSRPFGYWNSVGAWGAMSIALGLTWSAHDPVRVRRAAAAVLVVIAATATYLSYSRAAVGGAGLALLVSLLVSRNRIALVLHALVTAAAATAVILVIRGAPAIAHATGTAGSGRVWLALLGTSVVAAATVTATRAARVDRARLPPRIVHPVVIAALALALAAGGVFGPHAANRLWRSFKHTAVPAQNQTNPTARLTSLSGTRYPLWKEALEVFSAHPFRGTGAGTTQFWWNERATDDEYVHDAHNIWLQNLAELGLPGGVLIAGVVLAALGLMLAARRRARRRGSAGAAAALLAVLPVYLLHASVDWMWQSMAVTVLALVAAGVAAGRLEHGRARRAWPLRVGFSVLAAGAAILQLPGLVSTRDVRASQAAERAQQPGRALALASAAVAAEPWSASAFEQRGLVLEADGRYTAAAADLRRAIQHEPQNYAHWVILARIQAEQGQLAVAQQTLARAHQLRPRALVFRITLSPQ
jgi:hypothetical protein